MATYNQTSRSHFAVCFDKAASLRPHIAVSCSPVDELPTNAVFYVADGGQSGYAIKRDTCELCFVFSIWKGRGNDLMHSAVHNGAVQLDCFDGYLPEFYSRFGFEEYKREANWTEGGPDVVFMMRGF